MSDKNVSHYVYSTMAADNTYTTWSKGDVPTPQTKIVIAGGANVIKRKSFVTPKGAVTGITQEEHDLLHANRHFQEHLKAGFVTVEKHETDPEKAAANMENRDGGAQLTPNDYNEDENTPKPVVNNEKAAKGSGGKKGK